ncbi:MAG: hypothetical protein JWL63_2687 [Rhodocyclales bacterium]|nr:hypothetical protein [Rhodocyclales bacterium]
MISREELYELVWSVPMIKVGERFGVSGSYMARVCTMLRVPRPERGYWAKLGVGRAPTRTPLPEARQGDQVVWLQDGDLPLSASLKIGRTHNETRQSKSIRPASGLHLLIAGAKEHFLAGRDVEEGKHLKPYKKLLVDVTASKDGIDRALNLANTFFKALESAGHRVVIAPADQRHARTHIEVRESIPKKSQNADLYHYRDLWAPARPTIVYVDSLAYGLAVIEMSEAVLVRYVNGKYVRDAEYVAPKSWRQQNATWTTTRELPTGRLRVLIYSPYPGVNWSIAFQETPDKRLEQEIPNIVRAIEGSTHAVLQMVDEEKRRAEARHQEHLTQMEKWQRDEDHRRTVESVNDSSKQLGEIVEAWRRAVNFESFFQGVQHHALEHPSKEGEEVLERLKIARALIGSLDPLELFQKWKAPRDRYTPLPFSDD